MRFIEINLTNGRKAVIEPFHIAAVEEGVEGRDWTIVRLTSGLTYTTHESFRSFNQRAEIVTVGAPKEKKK